MTTKKKNSSKKDSVKNKNIEIKTLTKEIKDLNDKNVKLLAEFDNFQRRTLDEKEKMRKFQNLDVARDLLPAIDDLNRVVEFDQIDSNNSMHEAIKMLQSKIQNILSKHSINCFDSLDTEFDPNLHEALLEQNSDSFKKGKIMEEYEKGYRYHDKIIRHAKVVVSKGKSK